MQYKNISDLNFTFKKMFPNKNDLFYCACKHSITFAEKNHQLKWMASVH
jgi:hypothetical protein